jgi:hypothetical protein
METNAMTESQLKQDLRAVRAFYGGPEKWTQGAYALNAEGHSVSAKSKDACRWCLSGAISSASYNIWETARFLHFFIGWGLIDWNDAPERTFEDVIALLDKAIEAAP